MKLYQAVIDYAEMVEATRVPLDYEAFCPIRTDKSSDGILIQVDDAVNDYGKRTNTRSFKYVSWHLEAFDVMPFYFKDNERLHLDSDALKEIYRDYRSMRRAIEAGALKEVNE